MSALCFTVLFENILNNIFDINKVKSIVLNRFTSVELMFVKAKFSYIIHIPTVRL